MPNTTDYSFISYASYSLPIVWLLCYSFSYLFLMNVSTGGHLECAFGRFSAWVSWSSSYIATCTWVDEIKFIVYMLIGSWRSCNADYGLLYIFFMLYISVWPYYHCNYLGIKVDRLPLPLRFSTKAINYHCKYIFTIANYRFICGCMWCWYIIMLHFLLGALPYKDIDNAAIVPRIVMGYRLQQPYMCPDNV